MRTRHWIAHNPAWDAEPPDGLRLVGIDRSDPERIDLPEIIIRRVRTEVEQFRELITPYATAGSSSPEGSH
jgi:hypothetical protein